MSELIIHAEAEEESQKAYEEGFHDGYKQAMSEIPEIIRCKDCKHGSKSGKCMVYCSILHRYIYSDCYCSYGQREEQ